MQRKKLSLKDRVLRSCVSVKGESVQYSFDRIEKNYDLANSVIDELAKLILRQGQGVEPDFIIAAPDESGWIARRFAKNYYGRWAINLASFATNEEGLYFDTPPRCDDVSGVLVINSLASLPLVHQALGYENLHEKISSVISLINPNPNIARPVPATTPVTSLFNVDDRCLFEVIGQK